MDCTFCGKTFSRSDAVLRHSRVCRSRDDRLLPEPRKRGKKRSACDTCAKSKLFCDADFPCETCLANQRTCTYSRLESSSKKVGDHQERSDLNGSSNSSIILNDGANQELTSGNLKNDIPLLIEKLENDIAIPFLRKYLNSDIRALPEVFEKMSLQDKKDDETQDNSGTCDARDATLPLNPMFPRYSFAGLMLDLSTHTAKESAYDGCCTQATANSILTISGGLDDFKALNAERYNQFINAFTGLWKELIYKSSDTCFAASFTEAVELLSHANISVLITVYFEQWQPHSPVLHPSLFDPNKVIFPLLLAVVLIGAIFSSDERRAAIARTLIPVAEKWVFRSPLFCELATSSISERASMGDVSPNSSTNFESLQAAFIMVKILLREAGEEKVKEVRSIIFDRIISAARSLSLTQIKSPIKRLDFSPLDARKWRDLCLAETKIRLACGIFNHDVSFTIFNNMYPRLLVSELQFDMPCSVHVFDAQNPQECSEFILAESRPNLPSPASLIEMYCNDEWHDREAIIVPELTVLHHFVIVLGLLQKWTMRNVQPKGLTSDRMQTALDRWKIGWELCTGPLAPEDLRRIGFVKQAAIELWYLAKRAIDETAIVPSSSATVLPDTQTLPTFIPA